MAEPDARSIAPTDGSGIFAVGSRKTPPLAVTSWA